VRAAATGLALVGLAVLVHLCAGCAAAQTGCRIVRLADAACTTLVMPDGSELALRRDDARTATELQAAMARGARCR